MDSTVTAGATPRSRREMRRRTDAAQIGAERPTPRRGFDLAGLFDDAAPDAATTPDEARQTPTILTVCTGNICRSPLGEVLLRARLSDLDVTVHSAGTHALVGRGMPEQARELALRHGAAESDAAGHKARLLTEHLVQEADLVLAMTGDHSTFALELAPSRLRATFPVRVFERLAATLSDEQLRAAADAAGTDPRRRLSAVVAAVSAQRSLVPRLTEDADVVDPYRQSQRVYDESAAQLVPALDEVERVVRIALA